VQVQLQPVSIANVTQFEMGFTFFGVMLLIVGLVLGAAKKRNAEGKQLGPLPGFLTATGILMILGGFIGSTVTQVPAGYRAVRMEFGAVKGNLGEGIHFIRPGVDSVALLEVRTQKEESSATAASRDLQTVTTNVALNFRVDPEKIDELYKEVGESYKIRVIDPAVQESIKVVTAQYTAEDLIKSRVQVKAKIEEDLTRRLNPYHIVVEPNGLSITNFAFSEEFNRAIEAKQVAQQEAEKQKYVLQQAELQKQTEIARAQGRAESAKLNAQALKVAGGSLVVAQAWIEKWDGKLPTVSSGSGTIIDIRSLIADAQRQERANP
jgi:regulator of protease activity HflC (stomatin/prohibitin superfamily)